MTFLKLKLFVFFMYQLEELDNEERKKRFQNLLTLLENSTKLTDLFETRLKKCKLQIIK